MARRAPHDARPELTDEQKVEADRIHAAMLQAAESDLRELAGVLASKHDSNIFGATEFAVRDIVLRVGARAIATALEDCKKGVRRAQPFLPRVPGARQVPALAIQVRRDPRRLGSGPVAAACKRVVGQRVEGSGMRGGEPGADAVCHLRALFRSEKGQSDDY